MLNRREFLAGTTLLAAGGTSSARVDNRWEVTRQSVSASERGLKWLAQNQGATGNWGSNDLGLVALGALAFLSAGHAPRRSERYGSHVERALGFILSNVKPSGLMNISQKQRDMYNHGLTLFALTQAFGVHNDSRLGPAVDKGLKLISNVQCIDGGWKYEAARGERGHDLSLTVMQAKAMRAAMDMGLKVPREGIARAIAYVRRHYHAIGGGNGEGAFTYRGDQIKQGAEAIAMAACGAVCLQEFGEYKDKRINHSLNLAAKRFRDDAKLSQGHLPVNAYAMFYLAQGLYQVGGNHWKTSYPIVRDAIVKTQAGDGAWQGGYLGGRPGKLFGTSVGVFALNIPNRYLPILQRGHKDLARESRK